MKKLAKLFLVILSSFVFCLFTTSCKKEDEQDSSKYSTVYSDITKSLKLNFEYKNKSFIKDGAASATVVDYTDGDTVNFKTSKNEEITIRFYDIDTKESTTSVEKWGKAASVFTKTQLSSATEIVLEATTTPATHDTFGQRYLGYVWYKTATDDFKCLNVELVENGYSEYSGARNKDHPYFYYFNKATQFAQEMKLRLFSDDDDPLYVTEITETSIKAIVDDKANGYKKFFIDDDCEVGLHVAFDAFVSSVSVYSKNGDGSNAQYTFKVAQYDEATNTINEISLYAGYGSKSAAKELRVGEYYHLCGFLELRNKSIQLKGCEVVDADSKYKPEGASYFLSDNYKCSFDSDSEFDVLYEPTYFSNATVKSSEVDGNNLKVTVSASKREYNPFTNTETFAPEKDMTFIIIGGASNLSKVTQGKTIKGTGYQLKDGIITFLKYKDITVS